MRLCTLLGQSASTWRFVFDESCTENSLDGSSRIFNASDWDFLSNTDASNISWVNISGFFTYWMVTSDKTGFLRSFSVKSRLSVTKAGHPAMKCCLMLCHRVHDET